MTNQTPMKQEDLRRKSFLTPAKKIQPLQQSKPNPEFTFTLQKNLKTIMYLTKYLKIKVSFQIINNFFKKTDGRDKTKKIIQYLLKIAILNIKDAKSTQQKPVKARLNLLAKNLSTARKTFRLMHWLESYAGLLDAVEDFQNLNKKVQQNPQQQQSGKMKNFMKNYVKNGDMRTCLMDIFNGVLCVGNDLCDDVSFLGKIGVFDEKWEDKAGFWSVNVWMISIIFDMLIMGYEIQKQVEKINKKRKDFVDHHYNTINTNSDNNQNTEDTDDTDDSTDNNEVLLQNHRRDQEQKQIKEMEDKLIEKFLTMGKFAGDFIFCMCDFLVVNNTGMKNFVNNRPEIPIFSGLFSACCSWLKYMKRTQPKN